ncbi:MAG: prolipoprotein diacylglyceryl transferase [Planctomycetota bacterium]|nr:prolipoprotein diacylglyceryl transferase [Planctomycetota bacterium]
MSLIAEIPYPRIDPIVVEIGNIAVRWYGVTYIIAFALAFLVLRGLAKRGRWPVAPEKVLDVLFWGILGVFIGGRLGYFFFYGLSLGYEWWQIVEVWKGGMSFHGGLLGVIVAYWIYAKRTGVGRGEIFDGLALATTPGLACVRFGNFINAELWGRPWEGPWAMRFPLYENFKSPALWEKAKESGLPERALYGPLRHPSQLYEVAAEGILLYFILRWLMLKRGWGGGRIAAAFLVGYGAFRFVIEFFRQPDQGIGLGFLDLSRGQMLCTGMIAAGIIVWLMCKPWPPKADDGGDAEAKEQEPA